LFVRGDAVLGINNSSFRWHRSPRAAGIWIVERGDHCPSVVPGFEDRPRPAERLHQIRDAGEPQAAQLAVLEARDRGLVNSAQSLQAALGPAVAMSRCRS